MNLLRNRYLPKTVYSVGMILLPVLLVACSTGQGAPERSTDGQASIDQLVAEMNQLVVAITAKAAENGDGMIRRFNQPKTVACVNARFRVYTDIPETLKKGLFARPGDYPARLRFANATQMDDSKKDIRGLSIRVFGVAGPSLWGEPGEQDFLLNSHPALFVATPEDFLDFIRARHAGSTIGFFLNPFDSHLKSLWIAMKARKKHLSPLDIRYWSTVPFQLGEPGGAVVKYSVSPCSTYRTQKAVAPGNNQLRAALKAHLEREPACLRFGVQLRTDPERMPIEDASVVWDEELSPFVPVATITIDNQSFETPEALAACETSSFNPWQSLAAHRPLGRMNAVRRDVYDHAARFRIKE